MFFVCSYTYNRHMVVVAHIPVNVSNIECHGETGHGMEMTDIQGMKHFDARNDVIFCSEVIYVYTHIHTNTHTHRYALTLVREWLRLICVIFVCVCVCVCVCVFVCVCVCVHECMYVFMSLCV